MRTRTFRVLLGVLLGIAGGTAVALAQAIPEREPNNQPETAQKLIASGGPVDVDAAMGAIGASIDDLDFFTLPLKAGDVVDVAIENGLGGVQSVRLFVAVFKPVESPTGYVVDRVAQTSDGRDPQILDYVVTESGNYVVGVCSWPRYFDATGALQRAQWYTDGDYDLKIAGAISSAMQVPIAIKPGSDELAPFNLKANGKIPVALLSTPTFNPLAMVDPSSLSFGANGSEKSLVSCAGSKGKGQLAGEDLNGDGTPDLVCHFEGQECGFGPSSLEGILKGSTKATASEPAVAFEGRGWLKIVPP